MVLSSYIREGEYGFSSPKGCVEGLPKTHPEGEENPYSHDLIYEERHFYRSYRILSYLSCSTTVIFILSLSDRERMTGKSDREVGQGSMTGKYDNSNFHSLPEFRESMTKNILLIKVKTFYNRETSTTLLAF